MNDEQPRCHSCKAKIIWTVTEKGRRMPIDPDPVIGGNIVLVDQGRYSPPLAVIVKVNESAPRHKSHFVTCPNAQQHRKKKTT